MPGWAVDGMEGASCRLGRVLALDRARVRRRFEERFTVACMANEHVRVYERLIGWPVARPPDRGVTTMLSSPGEIVQ